MGPDLKAGFFLFFKTSPKSYSKSMIYLNGFGQRSWVLVFFFWTGEKTTLQCYKTSIVKKNYFWVFCLKLNTKLSLPKKTHVQGDVPWNCKAQHFKIKKKPKQQQTVFYRAGLWNLLIYYLAGEEEGQIFKKEKRNKRNTEMVCRPLT